MSLLTIAPIGGLCNRMRALNAALTLADETGSDVEVVWCRDDSLNCRFEELFLLPAGVSRLIEINLRTRWGRVCKRLLVARRSGLGRRLYSQAEIASLMAAGRTLQYELAAGNLFIETGSAFHPLTDYNGLEPVPKLAAIARSYADRLEGAVGVHLRRTDNEKAMQYSPLNLFVEKMSELLATGYCQNFFLASDSPEDEQYLQKSFPGRIITHPKRSYERNEAVAIKDALVDLYCLAQCKMIVGSYWSSFSETAALIGRKELQVINVQSHESC